MKKRKIITNLPIRLPIASTILYSFLLYHFDVDRIWWGIFISIYAIYWIVVIAGKFNEEKIDLFESKESNKIQKKSKFQDKLQKLKDEKEKN